MNSNQNPNPNVQTVQTVQVAHTNKRRIEFAQDYVPKKQICLISDRDHAFADGHKRVTPLRLCMDGGSGGSDYGGFGGIFGGGDSSFNDPNYWSDGR